MGYKYETYTVECKEKRLILVTDIHNCHECWQGVSSADRMEILCECLLEEYERRPYDVILALGDYSLDFWVCKEGGSFLWNSPISNTDNFVKEYVPRLPTDFYMIPGNHEQYGEEDWRRITGFPREYVIIYGDTIFVMLDTFAGDLDPKVNSDGTYTGINTEFLSQVLADYPDKRIILSAHNIEVKQESEAARELILNNPRIVCAFAGHIHRSHTLILPDGWGRLPLFYCGDFSYTRGRKTEKNWGYRILDLSTADISTEYVRAKTTH